MTTNHNHEKLDQLIERLDEINKKQKQLLDDIIELDRRDLDRVRQINERRAAIVQELIEIGTLGAEVAADDEIITHAIEGMTDRLRDTLHEIASQINEIEIDEPVADPLEQARAVIDAAAEQMGNTQTQILDELLPLIADTIAEHYPDIDGKGVEMLGISLGQPRALQHGNGGAVPVAISHLRTFNGSDELIEIMTNDGAIDELVEIVNKDKHHKMNAIALVIYGRARKLDDNGEPVGDRVDVRTIIIVHPSGMISFTDSKNGALERDVQHIMRLTGDQEADRTQYDQLHDAGRVPMALAAFYASVMEKIGNY